MRRRGLGSAEGNGKMVNLALRATSHVAAWLVWHSTHVSLLDDLSAPRPPHDADARETAA